ncbi:MAG: GDCCVxC domain-containing (seleno)protein [Azospirillaceae bacterium]
MEERRSLRTRSTITCPLCGHRKTELMRSDACQFFYDCTGCGAVLKPRRGDCCVFCSYGDAPCPPVQEDRGNCRKADGIEGSA